MILKFSRGLHLLGEETRPHSGNLDLLRGQQDPRRKRPGVSVRRLRNKQHLYAADGVKVPEPKTGMGHSCD